MAGLFSIFSENENNILSVSKGKDTLASAKRNQSRTKGLSVRSNSDLNVSISNNSGPLKLNSKEFKKVQDENYFIKKPAASPNKLKTPKSKNITNCISKKLSPKISSPIMQNVVDEFVFKKPTTPKPLKKSMDYPAPEKLNYYVDQYKYMNDEIEIFKADLEFLRSSRNLDDSVTSVEDEGFISDPELDSFELPEENIIASLCLSDIELPDISDCED